MKNMRIMINYCMRLAVETSRKSKDPRTKVGAVFLDSSMELFTIGHNRMPDGVPLFDVMFWDSPTKYDYVIHAEMDALVRYNGRKIGGSMFVTIHPCQRCACMLAHFGIKTVYYLEDGNHKTQQSIDTLAYAGIDAIKVSYREPRGELHGFYHSIKGEEIYQLHNGKDVRKR